MLHIKNFSFNPFREHTLLLWDDTREGVLVDPSFYDDEEREALLSEITAEGVEVKAIWLTHGHFDHIYGVKDMAARFGVEVLMHPDDREVLGYNAVLAKTFGMRVPDMDFATVDLADGQVLRFGDTSFEVITTPGHTPGSVCFHDREDRVLVCGDTLFAGSIGRTDQPGGDYDRLIVSVMDKLMGLDGDVDILPGHGPVSNIGHERTHNPFLQPFNEPEESGPDEPLTLSGD